MSNLIRIYSLRIKWETQLQVSQDTESAAQLYLRLKPSFYTWTQLDLRLQSSPVRSDFISISRQFHTMISQQLDWLFFEPWTLNIQQWDSFKWLERQCCFNLLLVDGCDSVFPTIFFLSIYCFLPTQDTWVSRKQWEIFFGVFLAWYERKYSDWTRGCMLRRCFTKVKTELTDMSKIRLLRGFKCWF